MRAFAYICFWCLTFVTIFVVCRDAIAQTNLMVTPLPPEHDSIQKQLDWLQAISQEELILIFSFSMALTFRRAEWISNALMGPATIAISVLFYFMPAEIARRVMVAVLLGIVASIAASGIYSRAFKPLAKQYPMLKFLICENELKEEQ